MGKRLKSRLPLVFIFLILVVGIGVIGYPMVSNWLSVYTASVEISDYNAVIEKEDTTAIDNMFEQAVNYNKTLNGGGDSSSVVAYDELLAISEAIAYIDIPKLGVYLPVYHGISDEVLQKGIGHMEETSLPVGGESSHCVLSGHTGLPAAKLFTDLDQMVEGDKFYIHVLGRILAYEVDQIKVVLPYEVDDIMITQGEDYITLVTCTPYGVNSHRLLVRGTRVEYIPEKKEVQAPTQVAAGPAEEMVPVEEIMMRAGCAAGAVILFIILLILFFPSRKKKRRED